MRLHTLTRWLHRPMILLAIMALMSLAGIGQTAQAGEARTLTGEYIVGEGDDAGELAAIFTPIGDATWTVEFRFSFQDQPHIYSGTADGNLSEGRLEGRVENGSGNRAFTFLGEFEEGTFQGTHAEIEDGFEEPTGTLTLKE